jgi:hypothetical protein
MTVMTRERAEDFEWGTYGLGAIEAKAIHGTALPPIQLKRLGDLDDDHLTRILIHLIDKGAAVDDEYRCAIVIILKGREADEADSDRHSIRRRDAVEATKAQVSREEADKNGEGSD